MLLSTIVLVLIATGSGKAEAPQPCRVRGNEVTLEDVTVRPNGARPFKVGLVEIPVEASIPTGNNRPVELDVHGPISFKASRKNVWFTIASGFTSPDGLVELGRGAAIVNARVDGGDVVGSAVLHSDDVMAGEDKHPDETVSPVRIPCSSLALGLVEGAEDDDESDEDTTHDATIEGGADSDVWWELKRERVRVRLYSAPSKRSSSVVVASRHCENCLEFNQLRVHGDWLQVERSGEGVFVAGWVRRDNLERIPDDVLAGGRGYVCSGDHGGGGWGEGTVGGPPPDRYDGRATVRAGTKVFAAPPKGEWALIVAEITVNVRYDKGAMWVELRRIPGLDGSPSGSPWLNAHVPVEAVSLPASVGTVR